MSDSPSLVYVADVLCSWCWGFAPTVERLHGELGLPVTVVNGGLRPGPSAEVLGDRMKEFLRGCWTQVHEASGQPFDPAGLEKPDGWRYDTELPAMAVATLREEAPEQALPFFHRLQRAFYAEAVDVTDPSTWAPLLDVPDPEGFVARATSDAARKRAWADFDVARRWGITGFPCLLLRDGDELALVTRGWAPGDAVVDGVRSWLAERGGVAAEGAACSIDDPAAC